MPTKRPKNSLSASIAVRLKRRQPSWRRYALAAISLRVAPAGVGFALWALVIRRPAAAAVALAVAPTPTPGRGIAFLAWYGPLGVAAIYYTLFAERYELAEFERVFAAATLAIAVSVLVFSLSATPGVRRYAGRRASTTLLHPLTKDIDEAP